MLPEAQVEYWRIDLDSQRLANMKVLAPDEIARAGRFLRLHDRHHYLAGRAALRCVLGQYTGMDAVDLPISYLPNGKPYLDIDFPLGRLAFNLSHSDNLAFIGLAWNAEIGVDIERIRSVDNWPSIARDCFTAVEMDELNQLPDSEKLGGFFAGWTRKEAFAKALGDGLGVPLQQFEVTLHPDRPAELLRVDDSLASGKTWQLIAPQIVPGYSCAIAVSGSGWHFVDHGPYCVEPSFEAGV
jgi:4'-phosphopantetheinyl transferase